MERCSILRQMIRVDEDLAHAAVYCTKRLASSAAQTTPPDEVFKHILGFWDPSFFLPARSAPIGGWW